MTRRAINWREAFERITGTRLRAGESANRALFIQSCGGLANAIATEQAILSCGDEFLPQCARDVKAGEPPTEKYWRFMITQLNEAE